MFGRTSQITAPLTAELTGDLTGLDAIPAPPPEPPTIFDRRIESVDGLNDYTTTFTTVAPGGLIIGLAGADNNSASLVLDVKINGNALDDSLFSKGAYVDSAFTFLGFVKDLPAGTHTITVKSTTGSSGRAALRIIETSTFPTDWKGATRAFTAQNGRIYGVESPVNDTGANRQIVIINAWADPDAYTIAIKPKDASRQQFQKVRDDLIAGYTSTAFSRGNTEAGGTIPIGFTPYQRARSCSLCMIELKGITLP